MNQLLKCVHIERATLTYYMWTPKKPPSTTTTARPNAPSARKQPGQTEVAKKKQENISYLQPYAENNSVNK